MPQILIDYLPAELRENKEWYIRYYSKNPQTNKLHLKKVKITRIKNIKERRAYGRKLVQEINVKLKSGWNPFLEQEAKKSFTKLSEALEIFVNTKIREKKRQDTIRVYKSAARSLLNYINKILKKPSIAVISFTEIDAKNYLAFLYKQKKIGNRTYNNYTAQAVLIWNFFIEEQFAKKNVFISIKKKQNAKKKRQIIDISTRNKINSTLRS